MPMIDIPPWIPMQVIEGGWSPDNSTHNLSAASYASALIMQAPRAGTINEVRFRVGAFTSSATMEACVQGIASTGHPDGTNIGSSSTGTLSVTSTGFKTISLSTGATVSIGQPMAVIVRQPSSAAGSCILSGMGTWPSVQFPRGALNTGSWAKSGVMPSIWARYSDGVTAWCHRNTPGDGAADTWIDLNSSPDEIANVVAYPFKHRVIGMMFAGLPVYSTADFDACVFRGTTELESTPVSVDLWSNYSTRAQVAIIFENGPFTFDADEEYRLSIRPTVGTNGSVIVPETTLHETIDDGSWLGGGRMYKAHRVNAGGWTAQTDRLIMVSPIIDQIDSGAAASVAAFFSRPNALLRR